MGLLSLYNLVIQFLYISIYLPTYINTHILVFICITIYLSLWASLITQLVKKYTCSPDPGSVPGLGSSPGEGIGYPLKYSWASLGAQTVIICLQCGRPGFDPGLERSSGGHGNPLQNSCLRHPHGQRSLVGYSP